MQITLNSAWYSCKFYSNGTHFDKGLNFGNVCPGLFKNQVIPNDWDCILPRHTEKTCDHLQVSHQSVAALPVSFTFKWKAAAGVFSSVCNSRTRPNFESKTSVYNFHPLHSRDIREAKLHCRGACECSSSHNLKHSDHTYS